MAVLLSIAAVSAQLLPSAEEIQSSFEFAQKFYAFGAYDQAIAAYDRIGKVQSKFLDTEKVTVTFV